MSIREIFCQEKAIDILQRSFSADKCSHAYIFAGPDGVGKSMTACEWAKLLLCKTPVVENSNGSDFADSCGTCESCRLFEARTHPDFFYIRKELSEFTRDGKDKTTPVDLPIDVIREFLTEKVFQRPTLSARKVFVVTEAERLNKYSQNALLKVLEEPPEYCTIILVCTQTEMLFPTIKSRCRQIRFGPIDEARIIEKLKELGLGAGQSRFFARLSDGSIGKAYLWAQLELAGARIYEAKTELIESLADFELAEALELAEFCQQRSKRIADVWAKIQPDVSKNDISRKSAKTIMQILVSVLQDALKINYDKNAAIVNCDQSARIKKFAEHFDVEGLSEKIIDSCRTMSWIDSAVNERLLFERLLLNLVGFDKIKG
jgi:DNA polymerase-3 subunit delta'